MEFAREEVLHAEILPCSGAPPLCRHRATRKPEVERREAVARIPSPTVYSRANTRPRIETWTRVAICGTREWTELYRIDSSD